MSPKLLIEKMDGVTTLRLTRQLTLDDFLQMLDDIDDGKVTDRRLWDATNFFDFTAAEIRQIAARVKKKWPHAERVAFVAADDLTFGLARMFEAFREEEGFLTKVFRDEEEARAWLLA
ncbi:MAG: STAS/SEC14 domain-containing protein [Woeseiaceae bacterium]|nr:STAS/SEC14 domain-containing protein [Woeseiaceae bacterium]